MFLNIQNLLDETQSITVKYGVIILFFWKGSLSRASFSTFWYFASNFPSIFCASGKWMGNLTQIFKIWKMRRAMKKHVFWGGDLFFRCFIFRHRIWLLEMYSLYGILVFAKFSVLFSCYFLISFYIELYIQVLESFLRRKRSFIPILFSYLFSIEFILTFSMFKFYSILF